MRKILPILIAIIITACNEVPKKNGKEPIKFNHLKELRLNGPVLSIEGLSYGESNFFIEEWVKGAPTAIRKDAVKEDGNMSMSSVDIYDGDKLRYNILMNYNYNEKSQHTGTTIMVSNGVMIRETISWDDNIRQTNHFKDGDDTTDVGFATQSDIIRIDNTGNIVSKVVQKGTSSLIDNQYSYHGDTMITTIIDKSNSQPTRTMYNTILKKDAYKNPTVVVISEGPFDGVTCLELLEYKYEYRNKNLTHLSIKKT